jgi:hypothetical protein
MCRKILLGLIIAIFAGGISMKTVAAKEPAVEKSQSETNKEDIKRALDGITQMEFVDTPIQDVIDYLKDYHKTIHPGFEMVLDTKGLNELGITQETPVTKNLKGISLRAALRLMLRDLGLTYVVRHEVLVITSSEEACYTKVYDVADLVSTKDGEKNTALDSLMGMVAKICPANVSQGAGKSGWPGWIGALKSTEVAAIVVHQPEEYQDEVADLLAQLRAAKHTK